MEDIKFQNRIIPRSGSYNHKLVIPEKVENKIRFLCNKIPDKEWSGILFYSYSGSFTENNIVIRCEDILLMDIGNAVHTEFDMSSEVIAYMTDNDLLNYQTALIHSHNQMKSFFSAEDISTLYKEGVDRNNFVSLIVNNEGTYTAAITRYIKEAEHKECIKYNFFDKEDVCDDVNNISNSNYVEYFLLDIVKEGSQYNFPEIEDKIKELNKVKNTNIIKINDINEDFTIPKFDIHTTHNSNIAVNSDILRTILLQLVTCSLVIPGDSKIDIKRWINNMPIMFPKKFGKGEEGLRVYRDWIGYYIEFLTWNINDYYLSNDLQLEQDEIQSVYAKALIKELSKFELNNYTSICLEELERYIIN